tara:strand:+ start:842 stop:2275 length:1434 start_codon:yes stop_codon:yes gene_type:complete
MNLAQIKGRIKNQLDYTPVPSSALGNYLNSVINDAYYAIWHRRPYLFNQKETNVRVFKDLANIDIYNGGAALGGQSITWTYGSTTATFARAFIQAGDTVTKDKFVGAYIKDPNGVSYAIKNVLSTTSIKLGRPYEGATASSTTFTVYHRFAYLPTDLVEIMDVSFPNFPINVNRSGKAHSIPRRIDVAVDLNQDLVGRKPHYYVPYSKEFANTLSNTLSLVADGSGALVDGDHYFAYSVVNAEGAESGLADIQSVTTSGAATITVTLNTAFAGSKKASEYQYNIYYAQKREGQDSYVFWNIGVLNSYADFHDGTGGNLTDEDTLVFNLTTLNDIQRDEFNRFNEALGSKKIRFFPRPIAVDKSLTVAHSSGDAPNELTFWHLRYTYKPQELADDYDVPSIPSEFHQLIIDRALIDVHAKYDNHTASSAAERRFASRVKALDARYSTERDGTLQRAQSMTWGAGRGTMPVNRSLVYKG